MAIRYRISTWSSSTAPEATAFREVKRLDAAQTELWSQVHAMIAADGGLDTERAKRLEREFLAFAEGPRPLGRRKHYATWKFILRTDHAGPLQHVLFVAIRD